MGELGGAGRKGSNYWLVHKLNLGLCTNCSRVCVCVWGGQGGTVLKERVSVCV